MRGLWLAVVAVGVGAWPGPAADPPRVRTWEVTRDAAGRVVATRGPGGREDRYAYSPAGDLSGVRRADGSAVGFDYTPGGARTRMADDRGVTAYEYDPLGLPARVVLPGGIAVAYRFDPRGLLRRVDLSDGWWAAYDYDPLDRPVAVDSPIGKVTYAYAPNRRADGRAQPQVVRRLPNGVVTTWTADARGELVRLTHERGGVVLAGWEYTRDGRGRVATARDLPAGPTRRHEYDTLGRLRATTVDGAAEEEYEYGPGSDLVRIRRGRATTAFAAGPNGELVRAGEEARGYTPAGELAARDGPGGRTDYRWDAAGRLVGVNARGREVAYAYDGDGNLVERRAGGRTDRFVYDLTGAVPVLLASGPPERPAAHHLLGPGRLAVADDQGRPTWLLEDHLGSVRLTTDAAGRVTGTTRYPAYGHAAPPAGAGGIGFAGEWADPDTGLVYLRARWYDPAAAQFLSPDPVLGDPLRPPTLNRYAYAACDPVNAVDPTGYFRQPPPPPMPPRPLAELDRLARTAQPPRVYPAAAAPADPFRRPDFYIVSGDVHIPGLRLPRNFEATTGGGVVLDRNLRFVMPLRPGFDLSYGRLSVHAGADAVFEFKAGAYWMLQRAPATPAQVRSLIEHTDLSIRAAWGEGIMSHGRYAVGLTTPQPGASVTVSADILASIDRMLAGMDAHRWTSSKAAAYYYATLQAVAAARAQDPYRYPSRERAESVMGDLLEVLGRVPRGQGQEAYTRWAMGATYSSVEQVEHAPRGMVAPAFATPGGGAPPPAPRVGGVYLNPLADLLVRAGPVRGVQYDPAGSRLVLLGDGGEAVQTGRLRPGDLAVVLRCLAAGEFPGFSIDPVGDGTGPVMACRYIGPIAGTRTGLVSFFKTDRLMKDFGVGRDAAGRPLRPKAAGFRDQFELGFAHGTTPGLWNRFWLTPGPIRWETAPDGKTLWCPAPAVVCRTETMALKDGKLVPAGGRTDPAAEAFAKFLTEHYAAVAAEYPEFEELRQLTGLVGLLEWVRRQVPAAEFEALAAALGPEPADTPATTGAARVSRTRRAGGAEQTLSIYGGVEVRVEPPAAPPVAPALAGLTEAVRAALPAGPAPGLADVKSGGRTFRAVSVPLRGGRAAGSLTLAAADLPGCPLVRHYNSTHAAAGPFGVGWAVLVPELRFRGAGDRKAAHLTDAWGRTDRPVTTADYRDLKTTAEGHTLTTADGAVLEFGRDGRLRRAASAAEEWHYAYAGGRLTGVAVTRKGQPAAGVELSYGPDGLVTAARAHSGAQAAYRYKDRRLVGVTAGGREIRYEYGPDGFLAAVADGDRAENFEYTADGVLRAGAGPEPAAQVTESGREPTAGGGTRVRYAGGVDAVVELDAAGRFVRAEQGGVTLREGAKGGLTVREVTAGGRVVVRVSWDAARRRAEAEWPEFRREVRTFRPDGTCAAVVVAAGGGEASISCDARGRPTEITDPAGGTHRLTDREDGWEVASPVGTGRVQAVGAGVRVTTPAGDVWYADAIRVGAARGGAEAEWARAGEREWLFREAGRPAGRVLTDTDGRLVEYQDPGTRASVRLAYGAGGCTLRTPDGRQVVVSRDSAGRVTRVVEVQAGAALVAPPE